MSIISLNIGYSLEKAVVVARKILPHLRNVEEASKLAVQSCPNGAFYIFVPAELNPPAFLTALASPRFSNYKSLDPSGKEQAFGNFRMALESLDSDNRPYSQFLVLDPNQCIVADVVNREGKSRLFEIALDEYHQAVKGGLAEKGASYEFTYMKQIAMDLSPRDVLEELVE